MILISIVKIEKVEKNPNKDFEKKIFWCVQRKEEKFMEKDFKKDTKKLKIGKIIFYISLIYYIGWICYAIWCFFFGSSWEFISSLGNHEVKYGLDAIENVYAEFILTTVIMFPFVPIYQLVYIIYRIIYKIRKKK